MAVVLAVFTLCFSRMHLFISNKNCLFHDCLFDNCVFIYMLRFVTSIDQAREGSHPPEQVKHFSFIIVTTVFRFGFFVLSFIEKCVL